jgi:hypothetical protein
MTMSGNRIVNHLDQIGIIGKLADLKDQQYHTSLALGALIELLLEKGIISAEEFQAKAAYLDLDATPRPADPIP